MANLIVLIALSIKVLLDSCPSSPLCPLTTLNNGLMIMCTYNSILILIYIALSNNVVTFLSS